MLPACNRVVLIVIICVCQSSWILNYPDYLNNMYMKHETRNVTLKQGVLQGIVVGWKNNRRLPSVEQFRGIPYAAAPVGELRFMPSGSAPSWFGLKKAEHFSAVCPQKFPDEKTMTQERREEFLRLKQFLLNQSEDCLYLNIYAPYRGDGRTNTKYPVIVYIHGESFEWNSGYPYDGSVLAAYGNVVVVTFNYRLGVLGFLKAGTEEYSRSNFGLVDQIAALLWVKENIAAFGGEPNTVTLLGHGTGAVCASLLMLSPMVLQEGNKMLFQRAILMGGSALSDWALAGNPRDVTYQVAQALNCQIDDDFAACLRRKRLDELMAAQVVTPPYRSRFGPVVDSLVVPNDPKKLMTKYSDIFRKFELLYGVAEMESVHLLGADALKLGMLEKDRDHELRKYLRSRCEMKQELCVTRTLAKYTDSELTLDDEKYDSYTGKEPDRALLARDSLLDILSDGRSAAPIVQMAKYHAALNLQSFFYVFSHKTESKEYIREKSYTGEELPYVLGVPLGGSPFHFGDHYTEQEKLFSEIIMAYFVNFAYTGDPNVPRRGEYYTLSINDWIKFEVDWPQFDLNQQQYLQLGIPPYIMSHYREGKMNFWNEVLPEISNNHAANSSERKAPPHLRTNPFLMKNPPPYILTHPPPRKGGIVIDKYENFNKPLAVSPQEQEYGRVKLMGTDAPPDNMMNNIVYGTVINSPDAESSKSFLTTVTIILGAIFLLSNILLFLSIYLKRKRKLRNAVQKEDEPGAQPALLDSSNEEKLISNGCNIMKIVSKSSRSDDTYEAVKSSDGNKNKLPRQMSNSTIDAHTKVRDWITNEIVYKYSPRFLRRHRRGSKVEVEGPPVDNGSTLGRSPTRPATPNENFKKLRPPLLKSLSNPAGRNKTEKISVAIDATPTGRGNSVLEQVPIELTKSLDRPNFDPSLRRSLTLEDFSTIKPESKKELRKSTTSINLKFTPPREDGPTVVRIEHGHSKSEPVQEIYAYSNVKKLRTFAPPPDVNVTSREEGAQVAALTPEESLMTIKRRNFPKVLPDYPSRDALAKKRRSMPATHHLFQPIPEGIHSPTAFKNFAVKFPPAPPLRTTSTLTRQPLQQQPVVCQSAPMLAPDPPASPEPEVSCNNLYFGPLIPKMTKNELSSSENSKLNTQPIYDSLRVNKEQEVGKGASEKKLMMTPRTIITTDVHQPIRKVDPKVIIKPTMARSISDAQKKNIPRVLANDNVPVQGMSEGKEGRKLKPSMIPTPVKSAKDSSSSESTPSEESDTGTVVKKL